MRRRKKKCALFIAAGLVGSLSFSSSLAFAQEASGSSAKKTTEPVFRVSKLSDAARSAPSSEILKPKSTGKIIAEAAVAEASEGHPLDRAIEIAYGGLAEMRSDIHDYTAIMVKREFVNGEVSDQEYIRLKIRCPRETASGKAPFSIYMKFLRPKCTAGREVIWVDGQNQNRICVHEGSGIISMKRFNLDPTGWVAMQGNRYPIFEAGIENLIAKLIEKAERDRNAGHCEAVYRDGAQINKRPCLLIELTHADKRAPYEFHKAQVFIDDELKLPVRYAAYDWPATPGGEPVLMEEYTYVNIKTNVGLTDRDFDPSNPKYKFPNR